MTDFDEHTITAAVLDRLAGTPDPRTRHVLGRLVRHLHDFVREVEPSTAEWRTAIDFLTCAGQTCTDTRQEFILLSDILGVSMLVDALNHPAAAGATETTVLGPFFVEQAPAPANGADIAGGMTGEALLVDGSVSAADGTALPGAVVDIWHADAAGFYDIQREPAQVAGRARLRADADGRFQAWTVQPACYPIPDDGPAGALLAMTGRHPYRPAHVHFMIAHPGYETLVTHVFVAGDRYLDSDAVFGVKRSLVCEFVRHAGGTAPDGRAMPDGYSHLRYAFGLKPAAPG